MDVRPDRDDAEQPHTGNDPWQSGWETIPPPPPEHASPESSAQSGGPPSRHLASYVPYIAEQRAAQQAQESMNTPYPPYPPYPPPYGQTNGSASPHNAPAGRKDAAGCASGAAVLAVLSKVAVVGKVLLPFLSAVASLAAYALLFGWQFGLGILALLFVHEMGHYIVIRAKGLPASWPVFIPLLGAYVAMRRMPVNVRDEAEIAIAGPFAGALASAACLWLYHVTGITVLLPLSYFSFFINLVNLIPVSPLDGGRIVGAISRWIWPIGLVLMGVAFFYTHSILLLVLLWLGFLETVRRFRIIATGDPYYRVPLLARAYVTVFYFGLAAALAIGMFAAEGLMVAQASPSLFGN